MLWIGGPGIRVEAATRNRYPNRALRNGFGPVCDGPPSSRVDGHYQVLIFGITWSTNVRSDRRTSSYGMLAEARRDTQDEFAEQLAPLLELVDDARGISPDIGLQIGLYESFLTRRPVMFCLFGV